MTDDHSTPMFQGKCLCGAVSVRLQHKKPSMSVCHCGMCRRWAGGPSMTLASHAAPQIDGSEHVRTYASSDWAQRGFCAQCGTHLFYRLRNGEFYAIPVGLFEAGGDWPFKLQVFIDEKPGNYRFADRTDEMTGDEVFKAWS